MSPIPRETTWGEVQVHHWMHSSPNAFIIVYAFHILPVLLVTAVSPALALCSQDMETPRKPALCCTAATWQVPHALTGVTSHRELSGVGSRRVSERPSVMTMATRLSDVNLRSRLSLVNCSASPV